MIFWIVLGTAVSVAAVIVVICCARSSQLSQEEADREQREALDEWAAAEFERKLKKAVRGEAKWKARRNKE